jgi:hypothetical protein
MIDSTELRQRSTTGPGGWNPECEPDIVTYAVSDTLSSRIARRFGKPAHTPAELKHGTFYGGYSEMTQENSTSFEVVCGDASVTFHPGSGYSLSGTSVYARFDAWLRAAGDPVVLLSEWLELSPDSELSTAEVKVHRVRARSMLDELLLAGAYHHRPENGFLLELRSTLAGEELFIAEQELGTLPYDATVVSEAEYVAKRLTDAYMPGERWA